MTEQERRYRRRRMERCARQEYWGRLREKEKKNGTLAFRAYVTAVLVGGCLLISLFGSKTSDMVCDTVKSTIAAQISAEEMQKWKSRGAALWKIAGESLPVFRQESEPQRVYRPDTEEAP